MTMSDLPGPGFDCAPGLRLAAHERLAQVHLDNLDRRLARIEDGMERLERRLWLTVYGVVAVILAQAAQSFMAALP